jgi:thymidylate synthase
VSFSSCDLLQKDASVSVPFLSAHAVEMIDFLAKNFKMRFNDFHSHATNTHIFENQFSVKGSGTPEKLLPELIELQHVSILHSRFNQDVLITFYASLPVPW